MSQILITGATGFIGRQLTRDLIAQGENVRILARDQHKAQALFGRDAEVCVGDLGDANAVEKACQGTSTIYNIAGVYRFGLRHRSELWRINVEGAEHVFRGADKAGTEKIVHLSSGGLLGKSPGTPSYSPLLDEHDYPIKAPSLSSYKFTKWHSEQRALAWARRGLPVTIASTTCPIGTGDETPTPTGQMVLDFLNRKFPFYCHTALNFIDVRDLSRGLQKVVENGQKGQRYLLSHENLWLKDFLELLSHETGISAPQWRLPNWVIQLAACGGEAAEFVRPHHTGARVCLETAHQACHARFFDNTRTREELDWRPERSIHESIRQCVDWFCREFAIELPEPMAQPLESPVR
jgi:dihydroflavonol-4-reductase